jgi:uncharacterized protein (DUF1499 family)
MKAILILLLGIVVLACLALSALSCTARPPKAGLLEGRLRPCPPKPNCVCSEEGETAARLEPLAFNGAPEPAWERLQAVLEEMGATVQRRTEQYLWATFRTKVFRFVDDVEFRIVPEENAIHVRSASRVGYSDLGLNRRRVEELRSRFNAKASHESATRPGEEEETSG